MIKVEHLSKKFGDLTVLKDLNTKIEKGEVIAIIGPSGTGKSVFLRCLNLLEKPTGGKIFVDGVDILDKNTDITKIRQRMGMVFQSYNLFVNFTVLENVAIGPIKLLGQSKAEAEKRAMELLKMVGLAERSQSFPDELSGGQKQRVAIARCLSMDPEIILFDEPTSALDPTMVSEVVAVIRRLAKDGMTMIIVSHEMEFARNVAKRVFFMEEGGIYEEGTPEQIFNDPQKEKTKTFINRIRSFQYHIATPDYDLYAMNAEIEAFCEKYGFPKKVRHNVLLLLEELLAMMNPAGQWSEIDICLSYSEKYDYLNLTIENSGEKFNPLEDNDLFDDLGIAIIRNLCENLGYERVDDKNRVSLIVKKG
jgi:polar amino acid transport system ATP-binding protein